jgi:hypothetical protein
LFQCISRDSYALHVQLLSYNREGKIEAASIELAGRYDWSSYIVRSICQTAASYIHMSATRRRRNKKSVPIREFIYPWCTTLLIITAIVMWLMSAWVSTGENSWSLAMMFEVVYGFCELLYLPRVQWQVEFARYIYSSTNTHGSNTVAGNADNKLLECRPKNLQGWSVTWYIYRFVIISWKPRPHNYTKVYFLSFYEISFRMLATQRECRYVIGSRLLNGHGSNKETWESAITNILMLCNKLQVRVKLLHFIVTAWPWAIAIEAARYREDLGIRASCYTLKINSLRLRRNQGNTFELGYLLCQNSIPELIRVPSAQHV